MRSSASYISSFNYSKSNKKFLFSLHIRSMWETICDAQAGFCTLTSDSKICVQILQSPSVEFQIREPPPPKKNWNLGRSWHFEFLLLQSTPPPPPHWNLGRSWHFEFSLLQSIPPPKLKFRQILALWVLTIPEYPPSPWKLKFRQILALWVLTTPEYLPPPRNWNLSRSWHFEFWLLQSTPLPPQRKQGDRMWRLISVSPVDTISLLHVRNLMAHYEWNTPHSLDKSQWPWCWTTNAAL